MIWERKIGAMLGEGRNKIVTFGEIMMRLSLPSFLRFGQSNLLYYTFGGSEANVAASLAILGKNVEFVTCLPDNSIGDSCLQFIKQYGIGSAHIRRNQGRLGIYFIEMGAMQRGSKVVYDRAFSAIANTTVGFFDWEKILSDAAWFHWSGITPGISSSAASVCLEAIRVARKNNLVVSCDLNYRGNLWNWGCSPGEVMHELVAMTDIVIGNEEDCQLVFGIETPNIDVEREKVDAEDYKCVCEGLYDLFPNISIIAITLRGSISASHNTWTGVLWDEEEFFIGPMFDITHIVDRIGGGDAFVAGLINVLIEHPGEKKKALDFALASSCLKHSIYGDFNLSTVNEIEKVMAGITSGRVSR